MPLTAADLSGKRRHKYGAKPVTVDGIRFASKAEAHRYRQLLLLEKAGEIAGLYLQPRYELHAGESLKAIGAYVADFSYTDVRAGLVVVEDVKGMQTPLYKWKKRHMRAQYGIEIREV